MLKTLTIDLEKEYRLRIEDKDEIKISFFKDVYKQAFDQVKDIVNWSNKNINPEKEEILLRKFENTII